MFIAKILAKELRRIANQLEAGGCEMSESEVTELLDLIGHTYVNKEQACKLLNMSRATFDRNVSSNKIPKGKKVLGYSELVWYRADLLKLSNV